MFPSSLQLSCEIPYKATDVDLENSCSALLFSPSCVQHSNGMVVAMHLHINFGLGPFHKKESRYGRLMLYA